MSRKTKSPLLLLLLICSIPLGASCQDSLLNSLDSAVNSNYDEVAATFKASRVINGQSIEGAGAGELQLVIAHRFGLVNQGLKTFFGLDDANTLLNLEYGITEDWQIAIQRSSFNKMLDAYTKFRFINQTVDDRVPLSVALFLQSSVNTTPTAGGGNVEPAFKHRLSYLSQLLLARKFSESFSLQLSPTVLHRNLVPMNSDPTLMPVLGLGARYKLSERIALNLEYFHRFKEDQAESYPPIAVGLDIETGGHVFQLHFTNARQMTESGFLTGTDGDFFNGDIHFGFNISRVFQL